MDELRKKCVRALENCMSEPKCRDCPWEECSECDHKAVEVPWGLLASVLYLLKPRLMTPTEIRGCTGYRDYHASWYEERGGGYSVLSDPHYEEDFSYTGEPEDDERDVVLVNHMGTECYDRCVLKEYNKSWRLWTQEPTEEEMKGAAWDE